MTPAQAGTWRLLGYGISLALQPGLTTEELAALAE